MLFFNKHFIIISSVLAIISAQTICPTYWWPMSSVSSSVSFFTEVMKGRNILYITGPIASFNTGTFGVNDRLTANNYKSITLTGASDTTSNGLIVTPDSYFCGGAFTISVWVKFETAPTPTAAFAFFKDNNAANVAFAFFTATNLGLLINAQSIQTNNAITAPTTGTWNFYAVSYEGAGKTPNFYTNSGSTAITAPTLFAGSGPIPTAPTCVVMSTGVIGANSIISANQVVLGSMNDFKIYNFGLTEAQIQSRFKAEATERTFTCSSSSINPQYFYIVLVSFLLCLFF